MMGWFYRNCLPLWIIFDCIRSLYRRREAKLLSRRLKLKMDYLEDCKRRNADPYEHLDEFLANMESELKKKG